MVSYRFTDVFVPGGFPRHTYNPRLDLQLETAVAQTLDNLCKLVTVTGHTKSGKTVLVRKVLPREDAVWIDGGAVGEENDVWTTIIDQLELFQGGSLSESDNIATEFSGSVKAGASAIIAKGEGQLAGSIGTNRNRSSVRARQVSSRTTALAGLRDAGTPVVIDDFHYLPRNLQGNIVRALKPLIFDGLPVVIIAIPHRRYDAVKVEREMTGRILSVAIPPWSPEELKFIPDTGFPLLESYISPGISKGLSDESLGSPHLMQEFCRAVCKAHGITTSFGGKSADIGDQGLKVIFEETAETIGRPIFEKLARGPRQRTDRIQRQLKTGVEVDIYGLVLHALAYLRPALVTLEYEALRSAIRDVSAQEIPQLHEVSRVLKHMSDIAATDESSTPVIDFDEDEKVLHVTDPFFAFYLRWGDLTR
jgi:hypothetical protein